jgi:hypothetical protein
MSEPIPLTKTERLAFVGHQARVDALQADLTTIFAEVAERTRIKPDDLGKTWNLDTQKWALVPIPQPDAETEKPA